MSVEKINIWNSCVAKCIVMLSNIACGVIPKIYTERVKLDSFFLTTSTHVWAGMCQDVRSRGPMLRRADVLWIITMNVREYARVNYQGVFSRWLSATLGQAFDWMRYHRHLESSACLNLWAYVRANARLCARKSLRQKYEQCSVCARTHPYTRGDGVSKYEVFRSSFID